MFGITSVYLLLNNYNLLSFFLVIIAIFCDLLDGYLARRFSVVTKIGIWLDSLSDIFLYLLFPAAYWYLNSEVNIYILTLLVIAGILRLLRFSIIGIKKEKNKMYYEGMPVFYSQTFLAVTLLFDIPTNILSLVIIILSISMVTKLKFIKPSVKFFISTLIIYILIIALKFYGN